MMMMMMMNVCRMAAEEQYFVEAHEETEQPQRPRSTPPEPPPRRRYLHRPTADEDSVDTTPQHVEPPRSTLDRRPPPDQRGCNEHILRGFVHF